MSQQRILQDGFKTTINIGTSVLEWKSVQPPGIIGGGAIDNSTMENDVWRTMHPKSLKTLGEITGECVYSTDCYDDLLTIIQDNVSITVTFPDGATLQFYGWLDEFVPGELTEGEQPTASVKVIPSLRDANLALTIPVFTPAP